MASFVAAVPSFAASASWVPAAACVPQIAVAADDCCAACAAGHVVAGIHSVAAGIHFVVDYRA